MVQNSLSINKWRAYTRLMRIDKPIGTLLLMWPTLWALWLADMAIPPLPVLAVFVAGVIVMRAAGCVINDYADRKVDGHVERTKHRPLASGAVSAKEAKLLFVILALAAFALVLTMNMMTIMLSVVGLALAWVYPFMKRYTHLPQVVLPPLAGPFPWHGPQLVSPYLWSAGWYSSPTSAGRSPMTLSMRWWIGMMT